MTHFAGGRVSAVLRAGSTLVLGLALAVYASYAPAQGKDANATPATPKKVCKHETCWGAVGFGPGQSKGYAYWYGSAEKAIERVGRACPGCKVVKTFANECGSLAVAGGDQWGFGKGPNKDEARTAAMMACKANGGANCTVRVWGCSRKRNPS